MIGCLCSAFLTQVCDHSGKYEESSVSISTRLQVIVVTGCFLVLLAMIATSPSQLRYDERNHIGLAQIVMTNGWRDALLSPENHSAAGPLYPAIHLMLSPITHLQPPAIRWVNFCCFLGVVLLLASYKPTEPIGPRILSGFTLLAVPFLWPAVGMALTELPALLFFTCFVLLFLRMINSDVVLSHQFGLAFMAGLCLGAAILGRQTYLIVLPVLVVMMFWLRDKWSAVLICIITALAVCSWIFALWHGLAPPQYYGLAHSSVSFANLLLSLSYAAVATLFLNPGWLWRQGATVWIISILCGFALAYFARNYQDAPAKSLLVHAFGMQLGLWIGFVVGCALAAIGAVWAWTTFKIFWRERRDPSQVFLWLSLGALVLAPMRMTAQFSSRYIVGSLGLLFLLVNAPRESRLWAAQMLVGSLLGMAILWTYFQQP
jgi:hypothetical protein